MSESKDRPKETESLRFFCTLQDGEIVSPKMLGYEVAEKRINEVMLEYEKLYFQDMTFSPGSITGDLFCLYEKLEGNEKTYFDIPFDLSIKQIDVKFKNLPTSSGIFSCKDKAIHLHYIYYDWRTILHEMIHAYSYILLKLSTEFPLREYLTLKLYDKLRAKIKNINELITAWAHYERQITFRDKKNGRHDTLFFMKSLDLELELNQPTGIIRGYPFDKPIIKKRGKVK